MLSTIAARLETTAARWSRRRLGADASSIELQRRRIYILPTGHGGAFAGLMFAMLLGSLNYGASLGFALTFLLAGLGFVIMHECHANLLGIRLVFVGADPVFAGETARFRFALVNDSDRARRDVEVEHAGGPVDVEPGRGRRLAVRVPSERRGRLAVPRFAVETRYPARLFRAWTWIQMEADCIVYPAPAPPGRPLPPGGGAGGARAASADNDADFAGLRDATPSDPPQRLAWKAYARSGDLLVKQFAGGEREPSVLDWDALSDLGPEDRLSQLARWCLEAHHGLRDFGLRLPGTTVPVGRGEAHLHACLRALAEHDTGTSP